MSEPIILSKYECDELVNFFINPLESWSVFLRRRLGEIGYIITRPQGWP